MAGDGGAEVTPRPQRGDGSTRSQVSHASALRVLPTPDAFPLRGPASLIAHIVPQGKSKKGAAPPAEKPVESKPVSDAGPKIVPGADPADIAAAKQKSKAAIKNEKRKAARAKEEVEVDKVAELAAAMAMGVTPPPPKPKKPAAAPPPPAAPTAAPADDVKKEEPNEVEKKVRALRKKLRAADELAEKQAGGTELNADQLAKVAARAEIEAEIARWEALNDVEELNQEVRVVYACAHTRRACTRAMHACMAA